MDNLKYCVGERVFMLDCARKYFTPAFIKRLIDEICEVGFNAINIHFSEEMGMRLESKQYPWLAGADHTLCTFGPENGMAENDGKFITQDEMREIVLHARSRGVDVIPSLDSPGHMTYIVKKYNEHFGKDIGNYFHKHGKVALVQSTGENGETPRFPYSRGIDISNPDALEFVKSLYVEYGKFFFELGCTSFDIGGDELLGWGTDGSIDKTLPKWQNLDHWQEYARRVSGEPSAVAFDAFVFYMNGIAELLRSLGYKSIRMWNDDAYRFCDTGWQERVKLDRGIDIQYWSPHTNDGENTALFYIERGHNLYNFTRLYTYYTLYPDKPASYATPEAILNEWNPYVFAPNGSVCDDGMNTYIFPPFKSGNVISAPNERVLGAGFCLWCDTPARESEDELLENMRPYFTAIAKKATGN